MFNVLAAWIGGVPGAVKFLPAGFGFVFVSFLCRDVAFV